MVVELDYYGFEVLVVLGYLGCVGLLEGVFIGLEIGECLFDFELFDVNGNMVCFY